MGWVVGRADVQLNTGGGNPSTNVDFLFDFADIDPEATTGRIEADKSDWFIKRVLMDLYTTAQLDGFDQNDNVRVITWALSTIAVDAANNVNTNDLPVFGPEWYNLQSRIIQTGTVPAYHWGMIPLVIANPSNQFAVGVQPAGPVGDADPVGWANQTPWFGPAFRQLDIEVSNAGLRNNHGFALTCATTNLIGSAWQDGDEAYVTALYRVLLQKRR